jgi:hypothetical protein
MAKDTLLKEAIADAKMVKEAAIANAMLTLKESFKPQLSSMLAAKLRNEEESYGDDEAMEEQKKLDSSDIGGGAVTVNNPGPKKPSTAASSSSDIDNPDQEVETFGEGIEDMFGDEGEEDLGGEAPAPDAGLEGGDEFGGDEFGGQGAEDDLDLEAIIRELEADLMGGEGEDDVPMEGFDDAHAGEEVDGAVTMETVEGDGDDGVHRDGKSHPAKHGFNGGKEVKAGHKVTETNDHDADDAMEEEVDLEEILREMEAEEDDMHESSEEIATENVELKRSLREHREVIKLLRTRINEVTLLNNKLMFTTKIFRNFQLSEGQKKKVVEQFDRATTLREAKLVYSTVAESLGVKGATPKKVASKITEGASKTVASTKPKSQTVLNEGDAIVSRLQKLAGIIRG